MNKKLYHLLFFVFLTNLMYAQKDSIKLANGQVLIGKIESMDKSILLFSTTFSDSDFKIKWWRVEEIYSKKEFIISLSDGQRFNSTINTDSINKKKVVLFDNGKRVTSDINKVIYLDPFSDHFFKRVSVALDIGVTLTKANNSEQITGNLKLNYEAFKWDFKTGVNLVYGRQDNVENVRRYEGNIDIQRFLPKEWFLNAGTDLLSNSEQNLKLRTTASLGGGYYFKKNNTLYFGAGAGLAYNIETYSDLISVDKNSLEAYVAAEFNKYDIGNLSILSNIIISPSLTENGRLRTDFKFDLKYDLTGSIYLKTGIVYNFDNQPSGGTKGDYVFQTTIGWDND